MRADTDEEMFEHPDASLLTQIHTFYKNNSKYDFERIRSTIHSLQRALEIPLVHLEPHTRDHKLVSVVAIGESTALCSTVFPEQPMPDYKTPFTISQQAPPLRSSTTVTHNYFVSTSGDKLENCVRLIEAPSQTTSRVARENYLQVQLQDFLKQADLVLVSVHPDDREDF